MTKNIHSAKNVYLVTCSTGVPNILKCALFAAENWNHLKRVLADYGVEEITQIEKIGPLHE